jgi:hypothetical protein
LLLVLLIFTTSLSKMDPIIVLVLSIVIVPITALTLPTLPLGIVMLTLTRSCPERNHIFFPVLSVNLIAITFLVFLH